MNFPNINKIPMKPRAHITYHTSHEPANVNRPRKYTDQMGSMNGTEVSVNVTTWEGGGNSKTYVRIILFTFQLNILSQFSFKETVFANLIQDVMCSYM